MFKLFQILFKLCSNCVQIVFKFSSNFVHFFQILLNSFRSNLHSNFVELLLKFHILYRFCNNFVQTLLFKFCTNFVQHLYKLRTRYVQIWFKFVETVTNFFLSLYSVPALCKLCSNWFRIFFKFCSNFV